VAVCGSARNRWCDREISSSPSMPGVTSASAAREAFVRVASAIDVAWLEEMFPAQIRREREVTYDEARERVTGVARVWYRDLLLREGQ